MEKDKLKDVKSGRYLIEDKIRVLTLKGLYLVNNLYDFGKFILGFFKKLQSESISNYLNFLLFQRTHFL